MNVNSEENSEEIKEVSNVDISKNYSKQKCASNKKKRNKKNKNEKSKQNITSKSNNFGGGILSEIKQISIPEILDEKENLFKILQSEIVNIDKGIALLNKKKKYYDEIIQKLGDEIQKEKKDNKIIENKNKEYIYMENLLKDFDINDTFENNLINDNSYYNKSKLINESFDYNYFLLNQNNNKNFLIINFFEEKNISKINNKMEPNYQMTYEEFNNIGDMDDNFCLLMNNEMNKIMDGNNSDKKEENNVKEDKIMIDEESERNENNLNLIDNTPIKINQSKKEEEFTIINEAPAEEEDTNNKKRKKNSINAINDIDKSIKKDYSNSVEELDFYLLKNSNKIDKKEKKKKTIEDIQKKYKVQDMGSDFLPSDSSSLNLDNSKEEKIKKKKKKKNKKTKKESDINSNSSDVQIDDKENNKSEENIDEEDNNKKNKKKGRKKRKKENSIKFEIEEEYPDPENLDNTALSLEMKKYGMKPQNKKKNIEILKSVYNFLKIKEMPENILKKLTTFDCDNNDNNVSDNDNDNLIGSKNAENELNDETKKKIIELIKENKNIYEKILLFKEISIKEVKNILNAKGIIVPNNSLSQLLINSGVVLPGGWNNKK